MNIFFFIYLPLLLYMLFDFKKAFLLYVLMKVFLNQNINLTNLPGVPILTLELVLNTCFIIYYFLIEKKKRQNHEKFPLKIGFICVFISMAISTIFSSVGFESAITRALQEIINNYIFVYLFWRVLCEEDERDVKSLIKGFIWVFLILGLYGFYEKFTGKNPLMDYEVSLNPSDKVLDWDYGDSNRLGMGRVKSAIVHAIGFGVYIAIFLTCFLFVISRFKKLYDCSLGLKIITIFICLSCLFFTNSRSPILYFLIAVIPIFNLKNKSTYGLIFMACVVLILSYDYISPYLQNITSIYSSQTEVRGSDLDMRMDQFDATFDIAAPSMVYGMGVKSLDIYFENDSDILGAESVWISLLIERGIIGCLSYIALIFSIFKLGIGTAKYFIWSSAIAWLVLTTVTSTPGCEISFFMTMMLIMNRMSIIYEKEFVSEYEQ